MANNRMMRNGGRMLALSAAALGMVAAMAGPASADDQPTRAQLIADCDSGVGKCSFNEPQLGEAYLGDFHRVSDSLYNCSTSAATQSMTWSDTVGSTDSAGVSVTVGGKIADIIDVSVTATYSHTWSSSHSETSSINMTVKPGEVGWISRAQVMQTVSGTWQTHYDDRKWGHYFWFVPDVITGPAPNGTDGQSNAVVVKSRKMTAKEKQSCSSRSGKAKTFIVQG
ncbi:hypothetical protein [Streptomyces sp. HUAS TT20]|uniref:hypothetical protein n=1 Tax=Streptomyces sp. HUAS TT20 TaxID=3447509 RepID=UPI0021D9AE31|nr:hypothetical protein [Streptomyces sp. HUAS 15-9]UXY31911.1 hypothetical protein N8I87_38775 [Streptomyces sp. HUAS 15-9]